MELSNLILMTGITLTILALGLMAFVFWKISKTKFELEKEVLEAEKEREKILGQAKLDAKDAVKDLKKSLEKEHQQALKGLKRKESEADKRFDVIDRKRDQLNHKEKELDKKGQQVRNAESDINETKGLIEKTLEQEKEELSRISGLSREEAKKILLDKIIGDVEAESKKEIAKHIEFTKETADREAAMVITDAMQRLVHEVTTENTVSSVHIPKEEIKGKIIGREGRNIRAFESESGVDVIIDDNPETITLSCFDAYRREIAKKAMEKLVKDGRIHPARIEEVVREMEETMSQEVKKIGEQAIIEAGFNDVSAEIMKTFGRLKFRHSYGQNQIQHSIQVMDLCEYIAQEFGLDVKLARRCGLLHDIGKALDQDQEGTHPALGYEFAKKHGENPIVLNAIAAHHEGVKVESIYTTITAVADAISAARPGARRENTEKYFERMSDLEGISKAHRGVKKAYAMRAGRELRISVDAGRVSDQDSVILTRNIAKEVESKLTYPGEVKVTLIRETRFVEFAR